MRRNRLAIGDVVGERYQIVEVLGGGAMGQVFVAENLAIGIRVAIKLLKPELLANARCRPASRDRLGEKLVPKLLRDRVMGMLADFRAEHRKLESER